MTNPNTRPIITYVNANSESGPSAEMFSGVNAGTILAKTRAGNERFTVIEDVALVAAGGRRPLLENRYPATIIMYLNRLHEPRTVVTHTDTEDQVLTF